MLAFLTGFCLGLAVGWISYIKQQTLLTAIFMYSGTGLIVFHYAFVMPTATASGAMDMGLLEFVIYGLDYYFVDFWFSALSWMILGVLVARVMTIIVYQGFEPEAPPPETREDSRRRVRAAMKYSDDYFD